MLFNSMTRE